MQEHRQLFPKLISSGSYLGGFEVDIHNKTVILDIDSLEVNAQDISNGSIESNKLRIKFIQVQKISLGDEGFFLDGRIEWAWIGADGMSGKTRYGLFLKNNTIPCSIEIIADKFEIISS